MQCEVWSVECEDFASSLAEKNGCRGKDTVGTGFSSNYIGHLFLGNFRRRLARVYVICCNMLRSNHAFYASNDRGETETVLERLQTRGHFG